MADINSRLANWSTTPASNPPSGSTVIGTGLDDNLQQLQATVRAELAKKGSDIAAAATTDLGAVAGSSHDITGQTTIVGFGTVDSGIWKVGRHAATATLKYNASSLILPGGVDITAYPNDCWLAYSLGSGNWQVPFFQRAAGTALTQGASVALSIVNITGGTSETSFATGDLIPFYDSSAAANRRGSVGDFWNVLNSLTEDTSPDGTADYLATYDTSANQTKKVKFNSFGRITLGTSTATTAGTAIDFGSLPAGLRRISIYFVGVSFNATAQPLIQIGTSGGIVTTGYLSSGGNLLPTTTLANSTAGFILVGATVAATGVFHGKITLEMENTSGTWVCVSNLGRSDTADMHVSGGSKALGGTLDRVRITTVAGTATFDAGEINISYET